MNSNETSKALEELLAEQARSERAVQSARLTLKMAEERLRAVKRFVAKAEDAHSEACEKEGK